MTNVSGQAAVNGTSHDHTIQATEMESLQKEIECQSSQVSKLASSLHEFQVWVVGAMQRESGEVKLYLVRLYYNYSYLITIEYEHMYKTFSS